MYDIGWETGPVAVQNGAERRRTAQNGAERRRAAGYLNSRHRRPTKRRGAGQGFWSSQRRVSRARVEVGASFRNVW